jgi:polyhydroxybutyrate depolymerase
MQVTPWLAGLVVLATSALGCERQPTPRKPAAGDSETSVALPRSAPAPPLSSSPVASPSGQSGQVEELRAEVHLPSRVAAGQKVPLLLILHSLGTSAEDIAGKTDWPSFAEQQGVAWLAPNGPVDAQGRRFWDAGPSCCNFSGPPLDHVAALRTLLEKTLAASPIDPARVFVGGTSNGGFMAHRFACLAPDLIRGIVSVAGAGPLDEPPCKPAKSLHVLEIHGEADPIVSYSGGHLFKDPQLPEHASVQKTVRDWATRLGCRDEPIDAPTIDLIPHLPGSETHVARFDGCARGRVELWTVAGGGHYLAYRAPAPEIIWRFLNQ